MVFHEDRLPAIVLQQTILMKYHALFVIFEKKRMKLSSAAIIGGVLWVKPGKWNVLSSCGFIYSRGIDIRSKTQLLKHINANNTFH